MSFIFGRRRSQSDVATNHADAEARKSSLERQSPSSAHRDETNHSGALHGLFRKRSDSAASVESTKHFQETASSLLKFTGIFH